MLPHSGPRKRDRVVVVRSTTALRCALIVGSLVLACMLFAAWEARTSAASTAAARRASALAAHHNSLALVRRALELQIEIESHEARGGDLLALYLQLDRERLPALEAAVEAALDGCDGCVSGRRNVSALLHAFLGETHARARKTLDDIDRRGTRSRERAHQLASEVAAIARADRERLRSEPLGAADIGWAVDAELQVPLRALAVALRRPNATFELGPAALREWGEALTAARREGRPTAATLGRLARLVAAAPIDPGHRGRAAVLSAARAAGASGVAVGEGEAAAGGEAGGEAGAVPAFESLLLRARFHPEASGLERMLASWEEGRGSVWDVVEEVERLREARVLPVDMLRLHEHEWAGMVHDASGGRIGRGDHSFDAEEG